MDFDSKAHEIAAEIFEDYAWRLAEKAAEIANARNSPVVGDAYVREAARELRMLRPAGSQMKRDLGFLLAGIASTLFGSMLVGGVWSQIALAIAIPAGVLGAFLIGRSSAD